MKSFLDDLKSENVLVVSALAVLVSECFVHPSADYLVYMDWRVLALLFCLMAVVAGMGRIGMFQVVSQAMLIGTSLGGFGNPFVLALRAPHSPRKAVISCSATAAKRVL